MTSIVVRRPMRLRSAAAAAALGAAVLITAGPAGPAAAAEARSSMLWISAPSALTLPVGTNDGDALPRSLDVDLHHDSVDQTVTDGRLAVDASGLVGVAEVTWPENCTASGMTAVCEVPEVPSGGGDIGSLVRLTVRAADGAAIGDRGLITYEATATGPDGTLTAPRDSFDTTLTVGSGPDLSIADIPPVEDGEPGDERTVPFRLTNNGNETAHGFTVRVMATHGLVGLTEYDACTYSRSDGGTYAPMTYATCSFPQDLAPGASFELPAPLSVRLAPHALYERLDIDVDPVGGAEDIEPLDNYVALEIAADNTAGFSATGAAVSGAAGEAVTARLTFANSGPAWVGSLGAGGPVAVVRLIVPEGTTVAAAPSGCIPRTLTGGYHPRPGAPRYDCGLPNWVRESAEHSFDFTLRIDTVVPGAAGTVSLHREYGDFPFEFDPDPTDNTAVVTVN